MNAFFFALFTLCSFSTWSATVPFDVEFDDGKVSGILIMNISEVKENGIRYANISDLKFTQLGRHSEIRDIELMGDSVTAKHVCNILGYKELVAHPEVKTDDDGAENRRSYIQYVKGKNIYDIYTEPVKSFTCADSLKKCFCNLEIKHNGGDAEVSFRTNTISDESSESHTYIFNNGKLNLSCEQIPVSGYSVISFKSKLDENKLTDVSYELIKNGRQELVHDAKKRVRLGIQNLNCGPQF